MSNEDYSDMFKAVVKSSVIDFEDAFSKAISSKVSERLRDKEISVSSSLLNKPNTEGENNDQPDA